MLLNLCAYVPKSSLYYKILNAMPYDNKMSKDKIKFTWKKMIKHKPKLYTTNKRNDNNCMELFVRQSAQNGIIPTKKPFTRESSVTEKNNNNSLPMYGTTLSSMKRLRYR